MQRIWGPSAGSIVTLLMLWTAFASVFSLLMGYSRIPYAAALDGEYFPVFARVHPRHRIPHVSLFVLGANAVFFCLFRLADVVTALVVIRLVVQFLAQTVGVIVLRQRRPDLPRPFRMWLYPAPAVLAFVGFVYVLVMRPKSGESLRLALAVVVVGGVLYALRQWWRPAAVPSAAAGNPPGPPGS
jgi:amino acid transporter